MTVQNKHLAVFRFQGNLGCVNNTCLHAAGPIAEGSMRDGRVFCPWHNWDYDFQTGKGFGKESLGGYRIWEEKGDVFVDVAQPLEPRKIDPQHQRVIIQQRKFDDNDVRILGISTTVMNEKFPRASTSEFVLEQALAEIGKHDGVRTQLLKLRDLKFRACEGYYSKDKSACIWPCSITQADDSDGLIHVYRGLVEWCDIVVVASPIRWNSASSLYYKMQERLNCIQNQITLHHRVLIHNKAACFVITGGQDGVQALAGQMMMFFSELGFLFPQFPFIGWSRGWYNEEMKTNFHDVEQSDLVAEATKMITRAMRLIHTLRAGHDAGSHKQHK